MTDTAYMLEFSKQYSQPQHAHGQPTQRYTRPVPMFSHSPCCEMLAYLFTHLLRLGFVPLPLLVLNLFLWCDRKTKVGY